MELITIIVFLHNFIAFIAKNIDFDILEWKFFFTTERGEEEEKKLTNILIFMSKRKTMDAKLLYHYTTCNLKTLKHKFNILNHFDYFLIEFSLKTNFFVKYLGFFLHSLVWYSIGTSPAVRDLVRLVRMI